MSPTQFHAKREPDHGGAYDTPPLKINKESYFIKKPPSSSSTSSTSSSSFQNKPQVQPRQPVIIYTHSPKVIHTHPRDFMALVQKLTGFTHPEDEHEQPSHPNPNRGNNNLIKDDNESTSVITKEHSSCVTHDPQVINSCFVPPQAGFDHPSNPCFNNIPFFAPNSTDFSSPFYNYSEPLFLMPNNMRSSFSSSSSSLEAMKELPEI